ncbi:MAG: FG-GAP repeat protein [Planctomycetota bacterium JB042]
MSIPRVVVQSSLLCLAFVGSARGQLVLHSDFSPSTIVPHPGSREGAAVAFDGAQAVIGGPEHSLVGAAQAGGVFVYLEALGWNQGASLSAFDAGAGDGFGSAVSLSGDTIAVGAPFEDPSASDAGSVYVFTGSGASWTLQAKLSAADGTANARFGTDLQIDGDTLVVGAPGQVHAGVASGAAYVYHRSAGAWSQQAKLVASNPSDADAFGGAVDLDGDTVLIGASGYVRGHLGAAFVFTRSGTSWTEQARLSQAGIQPGEAYGLTVALDGETALVGAPWPTQPAGGPGSVYVYERSANTWNLRAHLVGSDPALAGQFGLALDVDGGIAVIGAPEIPVDGDFGRGYMFERIGATWFETAYLVLAPFSYINFGFAKSVDVYQGKAIFGTPDLDGYAFAGYTLCNVAKPFGSGCAGSGGFAPVMTIESCLTPSQTVAVSVKKGLGGSPVLYLFGGTAGRVPVGGGCALHVQPLAAALSAGVLLGTGPGHGSGTTLAGVPPAGIIGGFALQAAVLDPAAPLGFTLTNGVLVP